MITHIGVQFSRKKFCVARHCCNKERVCLKHVVATKIIIVLKLRIDLFNSQQQLYLSLPILQPQTSFFVHFWLLLLLMTLRKFGLLAEITWTNSRD